VLARQQPGSVVIPADRLQHEVLPRPAAPAPPGRTIRLHRSPAPREGGPQAMVTIRNDLAKALRAAGLCYHEPTPRPTAARAKKAS
jgi:hypothetical protein